MKPLIRWEHNDRDGRWELWRGFQVTQMVRDDYLESVLLPWETLMARLVDDFGVRLPDEARPARKL